MGKFDDLTAVVDGHGRVIAGFLPKITRFDDQSGTRLWDLASSRLDLPTNIYDTWGSKLPTTPSSESKVDTARGCYLAIGTYSCIAISCIGDIVFRSVRDFADDCGHISTPSTLMHVHKTGNPVMLIAQLPSRYFASASKAK